MPFALLIASLNRPPRGRRPIGPPLGSVRVVGLTVDLLACPFCDARGWSFTWIRAIRWRRCPCGAVLRDTVAFAPETLGAG